MSLVTFKKAERLRGVCYIPFLKEVKALILSEYLEAEYKGKPNKIAKSSRLYDKLELLVTQAQWSQKFERRNLQTYFEIRILEPYHNVI